MFAPQLLKPVHAEIYVALRREMLIDSPWSFGAHATQDKASDIDHIRNSLNLPYYAISAVIENNRAIAATGVRREEAVKRRHIAYVWGVYVTPEFRRKGLARAVVSHAIATARTWPDLESLHLSVSENSPKAQQLYESLGFRVWGNEPNALQVNGISYAEIHMHLPL